MKYTVLVDDNYHYMDETERYELGEFDSFDEAVAACKEIVDEFLEKGREKNITAEALYQSYVMFGEDPFISGNPAPYRFSAWSYARARCEEICRDERLQQLTQELIYKLNRKG